jgi:hypothetical protein
VNPPWIYPQYCVLDYRAHQGDSAEPKQKHVILSAFFDLDDENDQYKLEIFVDPNWRTFVQDVDREYVESLLEDLVQRSRHDAEALFKHLCSLGAGPIVTAEVGTDSTEFTSRLSELRRFEQL